MQEQQFYIGVKALIFNAKGEILLLKRVPAAGDDWEPFWDIPGGRMKDQNIRETLIREVGEEIGVRNLVIGELYDMAVSNFKINGGKDNLMYAIYRCSIPEDTVLKLGDEHGEYRWIRPFGARTLLSFMMPKEFLDGLGPDEK